jgi:hypothetical protein
MGRSHQQAQHGFACGGDAQAMVAETCFDRHAAKIRFATLLHESNACLYLQPRCISGGITDQHLTNMMNLTRNALFMGGLVMALASCKKDDPVPPAGGGTPPPPNEQELITTVIVHLTSLDGTEEKTFTWRDLDGPGGNPPVIGSEPLTAGTVYRARIEVLDESDPNDVEDITEEIEEEADEHQFFFIVSGAELAVAYDDADGGGNPVGLESLWSTAAPSSGTMTIILLHEPIKDAPGVSDGDITNAGGDPDVEVEFPVTIE